MRRAILAVLPLLAACGSLGEGEAEKAVRHEMLDPDATQFRDVQRCSGDKDVWRGDVNGKNRMGAYVGFKPFFYSAYHVAFLESYDFSTLIDRCYSDPKETKAAAISTPNPGVTKIDENSSKPLPAQARAPVSPKVQKVEVEGPMDEIDIADDELGEAVAAAKASRCWADYCPCDKSDPDYGYLDVSICRDLKMGQVVPDAVFSLGAKSRDGRKAARTFDEMNP